MSQFEAALHRKPMQVFPQLTGQKFSQYVVIVVIWVVELHSIQ